MTTRPAPARIRVTWGVATHRGRVRRANEDAYVAGPPVFVVADGMGGHTAGAAASAAVVSAFATHVGRDWMTSDLLDATISEACDAIDALAADQTSAPGSTVTGVALAEQDGIPCWLVFNVGDSRTYRLAGGQLEQITVDHSVVQRLVDAGNLTPKDARAHDERNVITRALGGGLSGRPVNDQWLLLAATDDRILVCSDGLHGQVTDQLIAATLLANPDPTEAAGRLLEAALDAGGRDNVTVLVIDAVDVSAPAGRGRSEDTVEVPVAGADTVDLDAPTTPRPAPKRARRSTPPPASGGGDLP